MNLVTFFSSIYAVALKFSTAEEIMEPLSEISGHGFLIASDSLTRHPSGPAMLPVQVLALVFSQGAQCSGTV